MGYGSVVDTFGQNWQRANDEWTSVCLFSPPVLLAAALSYKLLYTSVLSGIRGIYIVTPSLFPILFFGPSFIANTFSLVFSLELSTWKYVWEYATFCNPRQNIVLRNSLCRLSTIITNLIELFLVTFFCFEDLWFQTCWNIFCLFFGGRFEFEVFLRFWSKRWCGMIFRKCFSWLTHCNERTGM